MNKTSIVAGIGDAPRKSGGDVADDVSGEPKKGDGTAHYSDFRKGLLLICLLAAWILANADRIAMSLSIIPIRSEFALDAGQAGLVLSSFYVTYALMNLAAGWMADRFGSRRVLVGCVAAWSAFTSMTGFAWSFFTLIGIRGLFGIGEGGFAPSSSVTIAEAWEKEKRARPKSFVIGAGFVGNAIGSGWIAAMIYSHGWRFTYHVLGAVGIVMAIILWFVIKESPARAPSPKQPRISVKQLFHTPVMRRTSLIFFFANMLYIGLTSWMPSYLVQTKGIQLVKAGLVASIPFAGAFLCLNFVGWLLDRYGRKRERAFLAGGSFAMMLSMVAMLLSTQTWTLMLFYTLLSMSYTFVYATVFAIPLKHLPDSMIGTASGVVNFGGQLAAAISPAAMGFLIGSYGGSYLPAFLFLVAAGCACFLVSITWTDRGTVAR